MINFFSENLKKKRQNGFIPVVVDFKCISPSDGRLIKEEDTPGLAKRFEAAGAAAISVVTETKDFGGSLEMLKNIVQAVNIPVLRKDFIRTKEEIDISVECGAKAVLLMCSVMSREDMKICYEHALKKGIEPLVETHSAEEMQFAKELGAGFIGINNRDILNLEKDGGTVSRTVGILKKQEYDKAFYISESGLITKEDVLSAISAGADGVLIGTGIWKAADPVEQFRIFESV